VSNIFKVIKSIQKIDRKTLPHAEKNLLISISIHLGENDHIWPTNEQMGERIGESKDYVKNLIMRLKNKKYIKIEGRYKSRKIYLNEEKIIGNSQLPSGNPELPPYIKEKEKKNIKENAPAGHSFDYFFKKIREFGCYKIKEQTLKKYWDMGYKADLMRLANGLDKYDIDDRVLILQSTLKSFDKKEQMKNERKNIKKNEAYKMDIAILADNNILSHLFESV